MHDCRIVLVGTTFPCTNVAAPCTVATWVYRGDRWTEVSSPTAPSRRTEFAFAYDRARRVCVLFGGQYGELEGEVTQRLLDEPPPHRSLFSDDP